MNPSCFFLGTTLAENPVSLHFLALAQELKQRGHQVVILSPHRRVDLENHSANPAIYTWPSDRPTKLQDARFFRHLIRRWRPSCVVANFASLNLMMMQGWLSRVPLRVAWYHTISQQIELDSPQNAVKTFLLRLRKHFVYRAATHIVANSAASALDVESVFHMAKSKCQVFHNAIADPIESLLLSPQPPTLGNIVCVGRFDPSKGQEVLIKSLPALRKKILSAQIEFIGVGPRQPHCQQLASELGVLDRCAFTGRLEHREVLKRMGAAALTVVPSLNEAFGLVNIESMAVGTPVVASKVGGIPEIIRHGLDGLLVPPDSPEALASAMKTILSDPRLRQEMRVNARQQFLSRFELSHAVRKQADWLETALHGRN